MVNGGKSQMAAAADTAPADQGAEPRRGTTGKEAAPRQPVPLSVVIPVRNDPRNLERCLEALATSHHSEYEVIVVDDASTDSTPEVARRFGVRLVRLGDGRGPAVARNHGAEVARHQHLFFVDADVAVKPETLGLVAARFVESPDVDAFFGSYDSAPGAPNLVSQYRNLLHHYVHQIGNEEASTFWSGCGAIRRSVFLEVGGFDTGYGGASIEDIELGARLRQAGHQIALVKSIQVKHLKKWTLLSMIDCDIRKRGVPWTRLILRQGTIPNDLNLRHGQRLSVALAGALPITVAMALLDDPRRPLWLVVAVSCFAVLVLFNLPFYRLVASNKGPLFAAFVIPLHVLYFLCSGIAFGIGLLQHVTGWLTRSPAEAR